MVGAAVDGACSFHAEFHRINQALKKGFFKKVDFPGSAEELLQLGSSLLREGSAPHAAICIMAAAQCQKALDNPVLVAHHEKQAGQLLWKEELRLSHIDDAAFHELVPDATNCYLGAIHMYSAHEQWSLAGALCAEMADFLWALGRPAHAAHNYEKGAQLFEADGALAMAETLLNKALRCRIESRDYDCAIETTSSLLVLLHRRLSKSNAVGVGARDFLGLYSRIAESQTAKVLVLGLALQYSQAFAQLQALEGLASAKLPDLEIHTVLAPLLSSFLTGCQARNRGEAEAILGEVSSLVSPLCCDLMLRSCVRL